MRTIYWILTAAIGVASAQSGDEFFEKRIRPVLVEKCYSCHNAKLKTPMGGLRLDSAEALRKGGDSGPVIKPSDPDSSRLIEAIRYSSLRLKMPPAGKLSDNEIADFTEWIRMGAPDPRKDAPPVSTTARPPINFEEARKFWAFQAPAKPRTAGVKGLGWAKTAIDLFVLSRLEEKSLKPAKPAAKRDWIRRITFDLIGLPPTPEEVDAFLKDDSEQADTHVVDRLLASPHYGERWARHWLDLVRFAETNGHEFDNDKLDAWRYRDYVIRAFNEDVPYNQFVKEQIAGDLLPEKRMSRDGSHWESPIGTGIYWFGEVLNSATDSVKSRADMVDNQIDVIGKTFLGLTVACARCHDHKFDPIPTADYYSLAGIMHSTYVREAVIDSPARSAQIHTANQKIGDINARIAALLKPQRRKPATIQLREGDILFEDFENQSYDGWFATGEAFGDKPSKSMPPNQPINNYGGEGIANSFAGGSNRFTGSLTSKKFKMPELFVHIRFSATAEKERPQVRMTVVADDHKSINFLADNKAGLHWKTQRMTKEIGRTCYFEIVDRSRNGHIAIDKIVISKHETPPAEEDPVPTGSATEEELAAKLDPDKRGEFDKLVADRKALEQTVPDSAFGLLAFDENPHNIRLHIRGSHENLGDEVPRHMLRLIAGEKQTPYSQGSGRLQIAEWIADPRNPLTARVMVNRIWKHHFGQGLVRSTDNFGKLGEPPADQKLLDWLALEFMRTNWSVKQLQKLMVLSNVYRMSSEADPEAVKIDPRNDLLQHMPVMRLEGEAIRDAILAVSGRLDLKMYGPGIVPHISKYQDGRGKPISGPLDANGRRSIYIQVRRNFLTPMFLAFDYPLPISTIGARGVSTVPSQALMLLNNEFVAESAKTWARKVMAEESDTQRRVERLYASAFARPPQDWELRESIQFIETQTQQLSGKPDAAEKAWADLCHVLINSAEFIYVR